MIPILHPATLGLARLHTLDWDPLYTSDGRPIYVPEVSPEIPKHNGLGVLADATYCHVKGKLNAPDELELRYPDTGWLADKLQLRNIIVAQVDATRGNQPLRIYRIKKSLDGMIHAYARSLAYDLAGIVLQPFEAANHAQALDALHQQALTANPFQFTGNFPPDSKPFSLREPATVWSVMGGREGSIRDVYGGDWKFDGYYIRHLTRLGQDRGVTVRYGVNMTDLEQDEACADVYTGVVAYWHDNEQVINTPYIPSTGNYGYTKVLPVDLTEKFDSRPSMSQLIAAGESYITANQIGVPRVGWKINWVHLADTEEYKDIAPLEVVGLGDTVGVFFERMRMNAAARMTECEWDVLNNRYVSSTLGSVKTLSSTLAKQSQAVQRVASAQAVTAATLVSMKRGPLVNNGDQLVYRQNGG